MHRAKVFGRCEDTTGIEPFDRLVEQVMTCSLRLGRRVFWVVDNGSSHRGQASIDRLEDRWPPAKGASIVDPALVQELVSDRRRDDPLAALSPREREVLALMAEGRSNAGIAHRLWVTEGTVEKHVRSILTKLNLPETPDDHRRVLAAITFLEAR